MDKVALVTGASRGIGAAILKRLQADGLTVIGTATSAAGAASIQEQLGATGQGIELRLNEPDSVAAAIQKLGDLTPTILVNNAGITRDNLMLRMSEAEWSDVLETNLTGTFRITKALLRGMVKARWGRVVNIGSVVGRMGNAGQANYVATKAAVEGFSRSLAQEVASRNITVNVVAPGFISTDMTDVLSEEQRSAMLTRIPAGRLGQPEDVAAAVAFLVNEEAGYITGQTLQVNGGMYAA